MFTVKIGPTITEVECPLLEEMAEGVKRANHRIDGLHRKVDQILDAVRPHPRLRFIIGPVSEQ